MQSHVKTDPPLALGSHQAMWLGVAFSLAFTALIWWTGRSWLDPGALSPDRPGFWYQWQLVEPTALSQASAWLGYLAHQVTLWGLIWYAQRRRPAYTAGLHAFNVWALLANAFFIGLHLLQTHLWYDGLAQDVPEWTAQWSVILLLVMVLLIENRRRGMFFGTPLPGVDGAAAVVRRYHGYYFAWATIYTFWYHPMEYTTGHLMGFLYMFLLLLQGSLFFTRMHVNRYWTVVQEAAVTIHALLVALMNGDGWPMFLTGFLCVFVVTQMHGLGLSRRTRWLLGIGYLVLVAAVYTWGPMPWSRIYLVPLIGLTEWSAVLILSALILAVQRLVVLRRSATAVAGARA